MKATRADVAKLAGVSTATVSNVLNNAHKVTEETIARVMEAVKQLDYHPDMVARSLTTRKTMQIGIVLENIRNPHYGEVVEHFEAKAKEWGYFVNICTGAKDLDSYLDNFVVRGVDGAFVAALPYQFNVDKLYRLVDKGIKVVVSGNVNANFRLVSSIENDFTKAMRQAMEHLISLGHQNIAYLSGLGRELPNDLRSRTYLDTVAELGLPCGDSLLMDGKAPYYTNSQEGYKQAQRLMDSGRPFTAAICGNDLMAIGAIKAFHERGLQVPRQVSVMGFDGIGLGRYLSPTLTTMAINERTFGEKAFELLYNNIMTNTTGFYNNELTFEQGESTAAVAR